MSSVRSKQMAPAVNGRRFIEQTRRNDQQRAVLLDHLKYYRKADAVAMFEKRTDLAARQKRIAQRFEELKAQLARGEEQRREQLVALYARDEAQYARELNQATETPGQRIEQMRRRVQELRDAREAVRRKDVEERLLLRFRSECDELRERESQVLERELTSAREIQLEERVEVKRQEAVREREFAALWEADRLRKVDRERADEAAAAERTRDQMSQLKEQMAALRARVEDEKRLRREAGELMLQDIERQKVEAQRERARKEQEQFLVRAELDTFNKARIAQKARAHADMVAMDLKIISDFLDAEARDREARSQRRVELRREMAAYRVHLLEQQQQAQELERELQHMYRREEDEAQRRRDEKLAREQAARDRLMAEVMASRAQQIREAQEAKARELRELQEERARLQQQIVTMEADEAVRVAQLRAKHEVYRTTLLAQMSDVEARREEQRRLVKVEEEAARQAHQRLEEMIQYELAHVTELPRVKAFRQDNLVRKA